ncbi:CHAT domain-containing protein (plasmid) [Tistrella mobilis]|uniref:CHAT domain-containing protein n=1 Tax=Tistrella mobilis TaxID=171437 RepID=UPI0035564C7F
MTAIEHALKALDDAERALQTRNGGALEDAVRRVLTATASAPDDTARILRARGFEYAAILAQVRGAPEAMAAAIDQIRMLTAVLDNDEVRQLLHHTMANLQADLARLRGKAGEAGQIGLKMLEDIAGGAAIAGLPPEARPAHIRGHLPPAANLAPELQVRIAHILIERLAQDAFKRGRSGETMAWLDLAEPYLHGLPADMGLALISIWGATRRAEALRCNATDEIKATQPRVLALFDSLDLPPAARNNLKEAYGLAAEIDLALASRDRDRIEAAFRNMNAWRQTEGPALDMRGAMRYHPGWTDGPTLRRDNPAFNVQRLHRAVMIMKGDDPEEAISAQLALMADEDFIYDQDLAFNVPMMLGDMLAALHDPGRFPTLHAATLLLKAAVRAHEGLRLDVAGAAAGLLHPMEGTFFPKPYQRLQDLLLSQGRIGEAIRIDILREQDDMRLPRPAAATAAAAAAARVPFTARESQVWPQLVEGARLVQAGRTRVGPLQWAAGIESLLADRPEDPGDAALPDERRWTSRPDVAILGYMLRGTELTIRCRHGDHASIRTGRLGTARELTDLVFNLERALRDPRRDPLPPLHAAWRMLIAPVADQLSDPRIATLLVDAAGPIGRIPFAALHDGRDFLVRRAAVVVDGTTDRPSATDGRRAAGLAVPRTPGMADLPQAAADLATFRNVMTRHGIPVDCPGTTATAADLDRLLSQPPQVLQISCHFDADPAEPGRSAFLLGDGSRFSLDDFARHDLSGIDLMLLMGCETLSRADAPASRRGGLDQTMRRLGVGAVLGALWPIDDEVAGFVLDRILENRFARGLDLAASLRDAQLAILDAGDDRLSHPHFWAPYSLSGSWS